MRLSKRSIRVYLLAVLSMLFWGLSFIWTKEVFQYYQPLTTIFLRLGLSAIILFIFLASTGKLEKIKRPDRKLFLLTAFFSPFCYFIGENFGLSMVNATLAAVIIATIPLFTPIIAVLALKEKLSRLNIIGIIVSFAGVLIMIYYPGQGEKTSVAGVALLFLAVLAALGYSVFIRQLSLKYSPITIIAWQNVFGAILFLPLFLVFEYDSFAAVTPNFNLIASLLQLAFFASSLAFIFFVGVIREIGISKSNVLSNLIPVFTAFFSFFILGEIITFQKMAGIGLVIFGVLISQIRNIKAQKEAEESPL